MKKVLCTKCHEYILDVAPSNLSLPLMGHMFRRRDREWAYFSDSDTGLDLVCPLCQWSFHEGDGKVLLEDGLFEVPIKPITDIFNGAAVTDVKITPKDCDTASHEPSEPNAPPDREVLSESVPETPEEVAEGKETPTDSTSRINEPSHLEKKQEEMKQSIKKGGWPKGKKRPKKRRRTIE